jgi:long-chain acyl-CoA synthetase
MTDRNLVDVLVRQAQALGPRPALRFKRHGLYHDLTWEQYANAARAGAAALIEAGIQPGDRVGLLAENSVDWLIADMAILGAAAINVPPHAPLTARQILFQLADAEVCWVLVSNRTQLAKFLQVRQELPGVRGVVAFDPEVAGDGVQSWRSFLQRGRQLLPRLGPELERRREALGPDDLATIMYTSGTTGNPKGVMLSHGNLLSNAVACIEMSPHQPGSVILNWLPFSHIYARTIDHYAASLISGTLVCLAESADTLAENLREVQPTHMSSVPRFYEKVLTACACPDPKETARRLRGVFGPRVDWLSSGGAPLPPAIAQAYHNAGLLVLQGYGLTESSPVISFNRKERIKIDTVGLPIPGVEVRTAPDGEVLTRGPNVMKGYWRNPQATAETIRDGWLHTGDLGVIDADGFLKITGRKKELMVLSNGKKVAPAQIEGLLLADPCIDQAVIYGEGRNFLTALVVPHWDNVRKALAASGNALPEGAPDPASAAVHELLEKRISAALTDVSNAEQVRRFLVLPQPFSIANDELTVSLKLRRNVILNHYGAQLEALYKQDKTAGDCGQTHSSQP